MEYKVGTPVVASGISSENILGVITQISPYSRDTGGSYKVEWSDGCIGWYGKSSIEAYVRRAKRVLNAV